MICGLFSVFDPNVLPGGWFTKWTLLVVVLILMWKQFAFSWGSPLMVEALISGFLWENVKQSLKKAKESMLILSSIFFMLMLVNLVGLVPFFFSFSSHLVFNISISLPLWVGGLIYSFKSSVKKSVAHFVPFGSPPFLWPLLVCVESVSLIIRPFTLSIRLMANVMAGHLIVSLVGTAFASMFMLLPLGSAMLGGLMFFETCVALVQSYVFMALMSLYWGEGEHS